MRRRLLQLPLFERVVLLVRAHGLGLEVDGGVVNRILLIEKEPKMTVR